jgi:hypothetical protein
VDSAQTDGPRDWEDRLAEPIFYLAVVFLVLLSGLIREGHHVNAGTPADMLWLYLGGILLMWPVFLAEGMLRVSLLPPTERSPKRIALTLGPSLLPPLRMAVRGVRRPDQLWLPGLGWHVVDYDLSKTLELFFSVPMMFMALLILPVLAVEYYWHHWLAPMESEPLLRAFLDVCISVIWIAFTAEFIIRMAAAESRWQYALAHWLDLAVVVLPMVEFLPFLRVVRLTALTQLSKYYRIYGVAGKGWRAFLVLEVLQRLTRHSTVSRLRGELDAKVEEAQELQREIDYYERKIAQLEKGLPAPTGNAVTASTDRPEPAHPSLGTPDGR